MFSILTEFKISYKSAFPSASFFFVLVCSVQLTENKFDVDRIRTTDLWCWKQLLYHLSQVKPTGQILKLVIK